LEGKNSIHFVKPPKVLRRHKLKRVKRGSSPRSATERPPRKKWVARWRKEARRLVVDGKKTVGGKVSIENYGKAQAMGLVEKKPGKTGGENFALWTKGGGQGGLRVGCGPAVCGVRVRKRKKPVLSQAPGATSRKSRMHPRRGTGSGEAEVQGGLKKLRAGP